VALQEFAWNSTKQLTTTTTCRPFSTRIPEEPFLFGKADAKQTRRMPTWTRMSSSFMLVVAAPLAIGAPLFLLSDLILAQLTL
jgi:hypothetical protein